MTDIEIELMQFAPLLGDLSGNTGKIAARMRANDAPDLLVTPECALTGYPVEDLVFSRRFTDRVDAALAELRDVAAETGTALLTGAPMRVDGRIVNAAILIDDHRVVRVDKHELPTYGVFDEARHFTPGRLPDPVIFRGYRLGVLVCEDVWHPAGAWNLAHAEADLLIAINASPYETGKLARRREVARARVTDAALPLIYLNRSGGQDELVFDGGSFVLDETGAELLQMAGFQDAADRLRLGRDHRGRARLAPVTPGAAYPDSREAETWSALVAGLRAYVHGNGFRDVLIGISGGIDSAVSAALAVDALGPEAVHGVMLPYRYTSATSRREAERLAELLGIRLEVIPIADGLEGALRNIELATGRAVDGLGLENLQARERGQILMTLSNRDGSMLLSTGNKSEVSVGYSTLYGDMCGGFNALKDVYKTDVYALARWRNTDAPETGLGPPTGAAAIPDTTIARPPSAELSEGQQDSDSLPDYAVLDPVLRILIDEHGSPDDAAAAGHDRDLAVRAAKMVDRAEYKRRQAAPGIKITGMLFNRDRRVPITNHWQHV